MISNYTCDILCSIFDTQQSDAAMKFLIGLNESYLALRSQLLLTSLLPSSAQVYALLLQEVSQRELHTYSFTEAVAMAAKQPIRAFNRPSSWKDKKKPKCTHCGYLNYTADKCFQLIGYPLAGKDLEDQEC
ncbi:Hypothetical predicted protein [Olea europaea subsp. europaea]|uniref:Uncharacterized protein n=1 Tax=Olea europaea subsp. europaea TaxID=158383 RepID=A0A8S0TI16_OLEEU|nr:Hypothetical predicted protein [Olea europaea subsp. europaea]